jgi:hypothetical protein
VRTLPLGDGITSVEVDDNPDPSLPLVVLLHGFGGSILDMTAPLLSRGGVAFDRTATFPLYRDEGVHPTPPFIPVSGVFADPPASSVTIWREALNRAGFATLAYTQISGSGLIAPNVAQLTALATGPLSTDSTLRGLRVAFVAHSRGGLIARSFLSGAAGDPTLAGFMPRVTALITLHSPNLGTGVASAALTVDALLASVGTVMAGAGLTPPGIIGMVRALTGNPAVTELIPGSPVLTAIAAGEPVPGVAYHTFGGTSTEFLRMWANVYTPDSGIPIPFPLPLPLFHWGSTPVVLGVPLNAASFAPILALGLPLVTRLVAAMTALSATTSELVHGLGDVLVADAAAHLPFSATRTTNSINHAEALWHPILQAQVISILQRLRLPTVSGRAATRIAPFPASRTPVPHVVTASDTVTGAPLTSATVTVRDTYGLVALTTDLGTPFTYGFTSRRERVFDPDTRSWETVIHVPSVEVAPPPPYAVADVDLGA